MLTKNDSIIVVHFDGTTTYAIKAGGDTIWANVLERLREEYYEGELEDSFAEALRLEGAEFVNITEFYV